MNKFWSAILLQIATASVAQWIASARAIAEPAQNPPETSPLPYVQLEPDTNDSNSIGQVTSVSQLSDVQPTDWAFQALQSLASSFESYFINSPLPIIFR